MKRATSKLIVGSALGIAAIAVAIDHTRHQVPAPVAQEQTDSDIIIIEEDGTPCGLGAATPCGLGAAPCSLGND